MKNWIVALALLIVICQQADADTLGTTLVASATLPSEYIIGPSSPTTATVNVVDPSGATLQEFKFSIAGSTTNTVSSVLISGGGQTMSAPVIGGIADISGLSIAVPAGFAGMNFTVTPTYAVTGGTNGIPSGSTSTISLSSVKWLDSSSQTQISSPALAVPTVTLVSTKPTVAVSKPFNYLGGWSELADITINADANGPLNIEKLPLIFQSNGGAAIPASSLVIENDGGTRITTASDSGISLAVGQVTTDTVSFSGGYQIAAGTSETFRIFGDATVNGYAAISTSLADSSQFKWDDVDGNVHNLTGSLLPAAAYPIDRSSFVTDGISTPEPGSSLLLFIGLVATCGYRRRN